MGEFLRRLWYLLNRSRLERELREEMEAHRAMLGGSASRFGNALRLREEAQDAWGWRWLDALLQDARFAVRLLRRSPAFTAGAICILAIGVGFNLAAFQLFDAVALSWLPIRSPETLIRLTTRSPNGASTSIPYPAFERYRGEPALRTAVATAYAELTIGDDVAPPMGAEFVTGNYFSEMGALPRFGRLLGPADDLPAAPPVVVLSEPAWTARFGVDPDLVGRTIRINGQPFVLAGIVRADFVGLETHPVAAWIPITKHAQAFPGSILLRDWSAAPVRFYGRLENGLTRDAAEAALKAAVDGLRSAHPSAVDRDERLVIRSAGHLVSADEIGGAAAVMAVLLVALVLVAACMNLGLLLLARSAGRAREFAIRLSVGASRPRIARQLLTEHVLIAAGGAVVGTIVSTTTSRLLLTMMDDVPSGLSPHVNVRVAIAAAALAAISSALFGFTPVVQALRPSGSRLRFRNALLAVQVAAACVLVIVSGLLARGITRVGRVPLGFDYRQTFVVDPHLDRYGMLPPAARAYWSDLETRMRARPADVADVAIASLPPFGHRLTVNRSGTVFHHVTPSYFRTLKIPIVRGRLFREDERPAVIVSDALARRTWPGEDPLDKTFDGAAVVGVAGDARSIRVADDSSTECYLPIDDDHLPRAVMVVRTARPGVSAGLLFDAARSLDPRVTPAVVALTDALRDKLEMPTRIATVAATLGICALLLAVSGLAGLVAFTVSQRAREIGVRVALGAQTTDVVRAIARPFIAPVVCGGLAGAVLAAVVATTLSGELFGISGLDPITYAGVAVLFTGVTALAVLPSIRRGLRVDPVAALRHE